MKGKELYKQYQTGYRPTVRFKNTRANDLENFDDEMMATLFSMRVYDEYNIICTFDFREFEEYNKRFEVPAWISEKGTVVWSESAYYPENRQSDVWIGPDRIKVFDILDPNPVYRDYQISRSTLTYVEWLEKQYKLTHTRK